MITQRWWIALLATLGVAGCNAIYYPPEVWGRGHDPNAYPTVAALDQAVARDQGSFRPDLLDCVARFDPTYLEGVRHGEPYRMSGWFVPAERFRPGGVRYCMVNKGWSLNPNYDRQKFDFDEPDNR